HSAVPASGGTLTLGGVVDLAAADPLFQLPGSHQVLSNIRLSPQLSRELLSRFNPVFGDVSEINGTTSLSTQNLVLPIGGDLNRAAGSGKLILSQMQIQPRGFLTQLLDLGTLARPAQLTQGFHTVRMSDLDF